MEGKQKQMLATLVGCNYAGTPNELRGCINDVLAMRDTLVARFGFASRDITVLTDDHDDGSGGVLPTGANIKRALADMVARAAPGDLLFFHYSGHGTLVPHRRGHGHDGGRRDEAIVPCDFNLITGSSSCSRSPLLPVRHHRARAHHRSDILAADVDFRQLVDRVPQGATFTMVSDSCHSGGLIDQEKEQIGPSVDDLANGTTTPATSTRAVRARFLPYAAVVGHLSDASGVDASHHVADHLLALFGADASAKFHHQRHHDSTPTLRPDGGVLLSGCQTDETSADVAADDEAADGGKACGAFSSAVQAVLAAHPAPLSNREVVSRAREVLGEQGFEQHPCLYCSDANADAPFLGQQEEKPAAAMAAL
ncbi:Metacaspase-9 [Dichanthelium oligosanthes]|uniref:Metacaspase-9 n=1 Tax=Dichanthelium oligosanthes TaxID=888268 RepID=A0A1E5VNX6_9POAL|nr:Metacaspase-9 [Dichanthelium oligosanthes]